MYHPPIKVAGGFYLKAWRIIVATVRSPVAPVRSSQREVSHRNGKVVYHFCFNVEIYHKRGSIRETRREGRDVDQGKEQENPRPFLFLPFLLFFFSTFFFFPFYHYFIYLFSIHLPFLFPIFYYCYISLLDINSWNCSRDPSFLGNLGSPFLFHYLLLTLSIFKNYKLTPNCSKL